MIYTKYTHTIYKIYIVMIHDKLHIKTTDLHTNTINLHDTQRTLAANYQAELASGSEVSTASTQAVFNTWGRVSRLGMHEDHPRRPRRRINDAYTTQLEQQFEQATREREELRQDLERERQESAQRFAALEAQ